MRCGLARVPVRTERLFSALAESFVPRSFLEAPPFWSDGQGRQVIEATDKTGCEPEGGSKQGPGVYCELMSSEPGLKLRPGFVFVK